jgi:hypothetical protein
LRIGVVLAVWLPIALVVGGLARGDAADFSGFDIGSKGTAVLFTFDSPSLGVPASPTGELNLAYSESSLRSGPSGYGLGSIAWPGQVAAGLPSFLQGEIERQGNFEFPADLPNYPVRAESFHPQGPHEASTDAGTTHMRSSANADEAEGVAYLNRFFFPALGGAGNQSSMSSSGFDPEGAVAMAEASANDVSLLGGLVTIDSVVSRLTARSDGVTGKVAGTTTVTGAEIGGTGVVIDSSGVHIGDQEGIGTAAAQQAVNQALASAGVSIELAEPVDTVQGAQASRSLGGLLIRAKDSTLEPLIVALPDDLEKQFRSQLTLDQEVTIQLAPAAVTAGAAKNIEFVPEVPASGATDTGTSTAPAAGASEPSSVAPIESSTSPSTAPQAPSGTVALAPVRTGFDGVPVWLVVVLVIAAFVSSRPLMAVADRLLSARAAAAACPEGRD